MSSQRDFEAMRPMVDEVVRLRRAHTACDSAPLCPGEQAKDFLRVVVYAGERGTLTKMLLTAVCLLAENAERLEVQRALTDDITTALDMAAERADAAERERDGLGEQVADLERRLAAAEAELTAWEDAADIIGPVGVVVIDP